jgi:hypothetical protein
MTKTSRKTLLLAAALLSLARAAFAGSAARDAIVKRIPIHHATAPLTLVGDYLFVAGADDSGGRTLDRAPALYRIDTTTLQVRREPLEYPIYGFRRSQGKLFGPHEVKKALATFDVSIELPTDPNNVGSQGAASSSRSDGKRPDRRLRERPIQPRGGRRPEQQLTGRAHGRAIFGRGR